MKRVLVTDNLSPAGVERLQAADGVEAVVRNDFKSLSPEEQQAELAEFDGIIVRSGVKMTPELLADQPRLKVVVRAGVGVDNINLDAATRAGVVVMNTPAGNTTSTAEHTIALLTSMCRNIGPAYGSTKEGKWDKKAFTGTELSGKTLAVVGLGRIGMTVARIARSLGMKVVAFDPFLPTEIAEEAGVHLTRNLDDIIEECDFLTIHTHLNDETRGMINAERMKRMKDSCRIINCARGGIVDEDDLLAALDAGTIAGAALDVYSTEPPTDTRLLTHPKILATPHLGASTAEAQEAVALEAAEIIAEYLTTGEVRYAINTAPITGGEMQELGRYIDLAYRLGRLVSQLANAGMKSASITYRGEIAEKKSKILTSGFAAGLLTMSLGESVNVINAVVRAEERGITLTESSNRRQGDFPSAIHVSLTTDDGEITAAGTVFGKGYLRLIRLNEFHMDAFLDGHLLIYRHIDRPGQIGRVGEILGRHQINIADMSLGRMQDNAGGDSVAVLHLDDAPSEAAITEICDSEDVTGVDVVTLPARGAGLPWMTTS